MAFDSSAYDTVPQTRVSGTVALVRGLITASKGVHFYASAKKALKRVHSSGDDLRLAFQAPTKAKSESATKLADNLVDRIWSAYEQRLASCFELEGAKAVEARRVHDILFGNGMGFLKLKFRDQWAEGEAILARIKTESLEASLDSLVGAEFLKVLRDRQAAYGEALGITKKMELETDETTMAELLRVARAEIGKYARVVAAAVDNEEIEARVAAEALKPLDDLRLSLKSTKKKGEEPVEPPLSPDPLPPVE